MRALLRARACRALLLYCESVGVGRGEVMRAAGVEFDLESEPEELLSYDQVIAVWESAFALTGDTHLALHVAEWAPHGARSILYFLCSNARSVGEAFGTFVHFQASLDNTTDVSIGEERGRVYVTLDKKGGHVAGKREQEWLLAFMYCTVRAATEVPFHPVEVELIAPAPQEVTEHRRVFGCPIRFAAGQSRMGFVKSDWELPSRNADAALRAILEHHARSLAAGVPSLDSVRDAVQRLVLERLDGGPPSIEDAAKALYVSVRTLQRRLGAEGISYAQIVDGARATIARNLLQQHRCSLSDVALAVGFSEQSSFTRAFKKWTGTTPAEFRRAATRLRSSCP